MVKTIDDQINELPFGEKKRFMETLDAVRQDSYWQRLRGLEKAGEQTIKSILYGEMFNNDFSYLHMHDDKKN